MNRIKNANDIEKRLSEIWNSHYMKDFPKAKKIYVC